VSGWSLVGEEAFRFVENEVAAGAGVRMGGRGV
jgi:hypothetical protein